MPERARELAQNGVADHHRRELAAGEDVAADRHGVRREVLDDALVEALVAAGQQRDGGLGGQLVDEAVVEDPPARGQREHAPLVAQVDRVDAVEAAQRLIHDVHAEDHAGSAAERRVVDLTAAERRVLPGIERAQVVAGGHRVRDVTLCAEPFEPLREQGDHVELHAQPPAARGAVSPRNARSTSMTLAPTSTERTASRTSGTRNSGPPAPATSSASHDGSAISLATAPTSRSPSTTRQPTRSFAHHSSSSSGGAAERGTSTSAPRSASAASRPSTPSRRTSGRSSVPARRTISVARSRTRTPAPATRSPGRAPVT